MINLKNLSLYRIIILLLITIYLNKPFILLIAIIYFVYIDKKELFIYVLICILIFLKIFISVDYIPFGYIETVNKTYLTINKILYKTNYYIDEGNTYSKGDIVICKTNSIKINDNNKLKNNIYFNNYTNPKVIYRNKIYKIVFNRINSYSDNSIIGLKTLLLNEYDNSNQFSFGYGLFFYYLFRFLSSKDNKKYSIFIRILLLFNILLFGFKDKYLLIIFKDLISLFSNMSKKKDQLLILLIILFNPFYIWNLSFIITIIFILYRQNTFMIERRIFISLIESLFFGEIKLLTLVNYKVNIYLNIINYLISLIVFIIKPLDLLFSKYLILMSFINELLSISIRGKINIYILILFIILIRVVKMKQFIQLIIICVCISGFISYPFLSVNFIDVGQGDAILIKDIFNTSNVLIDTGSSFNYSKLKSYLYSKGVYTIDYLIITHDDEDHSGNIENLKKNFRVNNIITNGQDLNIGQIELKYLNLGTYEGKNDNSLVYYLNINNIGYLFTGDISSKAESILIKKYGYLNIDILKVGHHGSKYSSSSYFIGNLSPDIGVISTNGLYDHPSAECLENLEKYLVKTYITKNDGDIEFIYLNVIKLIIKHNSGFVIIK